MGMQITVQNGLTTIELDVESSDTIIGVKAKIKDQVGIALIKQQLTFNGTVLDNNSTLSDYNIQKNAVLVLTLTLVGKRERQLAKLELAQTKRQAGGDTTKPYYRANNTYTVTQLPTQYQINDDNTNNVVNNTNEGGLVVGRPWLSNTDPSPVTQDLILFFDTGRTDCYPGTGTTIYNIVDLPTQTPSTIFGNVTFSDGILRIHNEDTTHPQNRLAGIECQTVTGFKTISLWYKQITSSAGYYSYIVDARTGMGGGWIYDTPSSDWFGGDWASGSMFINGGATQSPTYTQQLNVWRNVTFVTNDTAFTDNITLFSRFTREEGLDVEFGAVMIYSRAITEAENKHNYDQFKTKYSAIPQVYTGLAFNYGEATISFTLTSGIFSDVTCPYGAGGYPYGPGVDPVLLMPGNQLAGGTSPANDIYWEYTAVDGVITGFTYRSGSPP